MQGHSTIVRWRSVVMTTFALLVLGSHGGTAQTIACKGIFSFGDAIVRKVSLTADLETAAVQTKSCHIYPELAGFCLGELLEAGDHFFVFGSIGSEENTKMWVRLYHPTDVVPVSHPPAPEMSLKVLFLGRCEPAAKRIRHRKHA